MKNLLLFSWKVFWVDSSWYVSLCDQNFLLFLNWNEATKEWLSNSVRTNFNLTSFSYNSCASIFFLFSYLEGCRGGWHWETWSELDTTPALWSLCNILAQLAGVTGVVSLERDKAHSILSVSEYSCINIVYLLPDSKREDNIKKKLVWKVRM